MCSWTHVTWAEALPGDDDRHDVALQLDAQTEWRDVEQHLHASCGMCSVNINHLRRHVGVLIC